MTGIEIAVATYLFAWLKRRGKPIAERAGQEADTAAELLMDKLHATVVAKFGPEDRGLARLAREAGEDLPEPSATATGLVTASLTDAMEGDAEFAEALARAVRDLRAAEGPGTAGGTTFSGNTFNGPTAIQVGDHSRQTNRFGR